MSKLKSLQATLSEKQTLCEQLTQQAASLTTELAALDTTATTHRVAFEAQNALRTEEIAELTTAFEKARIHKDAKYKELQALQNQKSTSLFYSVQFCHADNDNKRLVCSAGTLDTEVAAGETALRAITLTLRQEQATTEKIDTEVLHLDSRVHALREELSAARAASEQAAKGAMISAF